MVIKHKITLSFSLLLILVLVAFWLSLKLQLQQTVAQQADAMGEILARQTADSVTELVLANDLLGLNVAGADRVFVGIKAAKRFDSASLSLRPNVLSANVGDALYAHELCVRGRFVPAATP